MDNKDFMAIVADIHNGLSEISVRGEDAIRMAGIIQKCRSIVLSLQDELSKEESK